jgi:hypothetical protein
LSRVFYRDGAQAMVGVRHIDMLSSTTVCVWLAPGPVPTAKLRRRGSVGS